MSFPFFRMRRRRQNEVVRRFFRETRLSVDQLVMPYFVVHGKGIKRPITSLPGQFHFSLDMLLKEVEELTKLGVFAILLFGIPQKKDSKASEAYDPEGIVQKAVRALRASFPDLLVMTDVCLCEYMDYGHCGLVEGEKVVNDGSLEWLAKVALSHAEAGAQMVAPSDMMDGRIGIIRKRLDEAGYEEVMILSYAAKYASVFYGPFREAVGSAPSFGDRKTYQMDPANSDEALQEIGLDIEEGADCVMIKPALPYLDVIRRAKDLFHVPLAAYQVSGEYAMIKAAAAQGAFDEKAAILESLLSIRRAGADILVTYFAKEVAKEISHR